MGRSFANIKMKAQFASVLIFALSLGSPVRADLCDDTLTLGTTGTDITLTLPTTDRSTKCRRSLVLSGGSQVHCGWAFPYRAPEATAAFERLVTTIAACLGADASVTADLDVNHPDFYDLQTFQSKGREIGVSLKDKAGLSETYVFLRIAVQD